MAEVEDVLKPVLEKIAEEQDYNDYTTEISSINNGGANYCSQIYNITFSAPGKDDIKLFAKVAAAGEKYRMMNTMQLFKTETVFYTTILSQYREFEEKYNFPKEDKLILPKCYGVDTDYMKETIVLDDLKSNGYQSFDRFKCYEWEYASKCVSYLAKLHALSVCYERNCPEEFVDTAQKVAVKVPIDKMKEFTKKGMVAAVGATDDEYQERLENFVLANITDEQFNDYYNPPRKVVLKHGDFRPSNIMHKTNDDGDLEIVAVDYQLLRKGNPVEDLMFFLITGSDEEFRKKHLNQYFEHYYDEFSRILRKLEINPDEVYSRDQFDGDVKKMLPFGIMLAVVILPIVTVNVQGAPKKEEGSTFDNIVNEPNSLFQNRFGGLVRDYVRMGIL